MNLRDLRYLVAVAEHGHFGRAADACFVSQPTLSTQIKKLEETLGVVLIERTNRKVMLTPVGNAIVAQAQTVLRSVSDLERIADEFRDPFGGEFRLGIIPTVAPYLLPKILGPIRKRFPNLSISLTEAQTAVISAQLKTGELDAVVLALPLGEEQLIEREIYKEPFYLALSKLRCKANRKTAALSDLDSEEVLLLEDGHCLRDQALDVCNSRNAVENTNFRATSLETLRQMVAADAGVTLMPKLAVPAAKGTVRYLPFKGSDVPHRRIGLCWRASSTRGALMEDMAELLAGLKLADG
ncbi:MAG: LysR substrate-binding domain-containing protein [Pseudomonadaceae bacterium]|nr:LysR substrate-binding domain-containing protein [Pseudomonadaceae bacterium]